MTSWRADKRTTAERGYGARWQRLAKRFLAEPGNALCRMCQAEGRMVAAQVVDHIIPHRGDEALFWDRSNWQPRPQALGRPGQPPRRPPEQNAADL